MCEWSFQRRTRPGPCATDWRTTNGILYPEREKEGKEKRRDTEKGGLEVFQASSVWGPICRSEMPYHMTCLTFGPRSAKTVMLLSNGKHKASQPQRPPFTPLCSRTPKVIGKSNVNDLHFPSRCRRAKLLRFPDNVKGRGWPFWLLTCRFCLPPLRWSVEQISSGVKLSFWIKTNFTFLGLQN